MIVLLLNDKAALLVVHLCLRRSFLAVSTPTTLHAFRVFPGYWGRVTEEASGVVDNQNKLEFAL